MATPTYSYKHGVMVVACEKHGEVDERMVCEDFEKHPLLQEPDICEELTVKCYICKSDVTLQKAKMMDGRVVCPRHADFHAKKPELLNLEPDAYKYIRLSDGTVVTWKCGFTQPSHKAMANSVDKPVISAGTISVFADEWRLVERGSMSLGIPTLPDDEDVLTLSLRIPQGDE